MLFSDLQPVRKREVASAVAHYIAGVLDREAMAAIIETLSENSDFKPGDRVRTMRGSSHGTILRILEDGRVVWKIDGSGSKLISLPESLLCDG